MVRAFVSRWQKKVKVLESGAHYCSEKILDLVIYLLDYLEAIVHTGGLRGLCKLVQVLVLGLGYLLLGIGQSMCGGSEAASS